MNSEKIAAMPAQERIDAVEVQERLSWPSAPAAAYCDTWLMVNAGALNFKASKEHQVAAMANIGHQLLQEIAAYRPAFEWTTSPIEIIGALVEEAAASTAAGFAKDLGSPFSPTEAQFKEWCERHDLPEHLYREAFHDAASLYLVDQADLDADKVGAQ